MQASCSRVRPSSRRSCLTPCSPGRRSKRSPTTASRTRRRSPRPTVSSTSRCRRTPCTTACARCHRTSGPGRDRRTPADRLAHARRRRASRAARCPAGRAEADDVRGIPSRRPMTARQAAYEVVLRVFEDDAYADRVLRSAARGLDTRDRALAQRLPSGTRQRVRTLHHAIEKLGRRPVRKLDPPVRAALRLGAYQLAYAEGIATHAAVNETVELVRRARLER